eukprot:TRINITY_DN15172_c0_g1_i1.p1 TRINITY_DN15172_c0_g1~~TRINITY_DN15172_c0_g1_i1.p1  ORF type:complete len:180 (-),score=11.24 TRINITY_DN15172_c0_g1_i1:125-664(-)
MPKFETLSHTFRHPWSEVSLASWRKYPCEARPDVLSVDLVEKNFNTETGVLSGKRFLVNKSQIPSWISRMFGCNGLLLFCEEFQVDPINKKMVLKSRNLSFTNMIQSEETCTYTIDPENQQWTAFKQEMKVTAFPHGFASKIENYSATKFREYAGVGRSIMEAAIAKVRLEHGLLNQTN